MTHTNKLAAAIGSRLARKMFAKRGNHTEIHLTEAQLAAAIALGVQVTLEAVVEHAPASPVAQAIRNAAVKS